ncbi:MAG: glycosyltransferase [Candidatus Anstonellales archaeon]
MRVSVIIPTYNEEKRIERCLKAIIDQTYKGEVEIVIADAESGDRTCEIARRYTDKVFVFKKSTISAGRRDGASKATGDLLVSTDADSVPDKNWLSEIVRVFDDQSVCCAHGNVYLLDANWFDDFVVRTIMPLYYWFFNFLGHPTGPGSNIAIRKGTYEMIGGYNPNLVTGEDLDLQRRAKKVGKVVFAKKAIVYTSSRRLRAWGYLKFFLFHFGNLIGSIIFKKPAERYEPIR